MPPGGKEIRVDFEPRQIASRNVVNPTEIYTKPLQTLRYL